jgi:hypothetical protein
MRSKTRIVLSAAATASIAWQLPSSAQGQGTVATDSFKSEASASDAAAPEATAAPPLSTSAIPAKTVVEVEITEPISSKTNVIGDAFGLKLAAPLMRGDRVVLPARLTGRGEVTHAAKRGAGGKAGELIVNARYLECGDLRIPLGHFHLGVAGKGNVGGAFAAGQVIPFGQFLVSGDDAVIPAGTGGTAQIKADVVLPDGAVASCGAGQS